MRIRVDPIEREVFGSALAALNQARVRYVLAGSYATHHYTSIWRDTKDMDIFLVPEDAPRSLGMLAAIGFDTRMVDRHWLAKAFKGEYMIDLIFGQGNWLNPIDHIWFDRADSGMLFGHHVRFAPVEEVIWSKAYVAHRERYDGADIMHLIRYAHDKIDWDHIVARFNDHWDLLFSYLILYRFVYPSDRDDIPRRIMHELTHRLDEQIDQLAPAERICRGTLIDRFSYLFDVEQKGYTDPRDELARAWGYPVEDVAHERSWARGVLRKPENGYEEGRSKRIEGYLPSGEAGTDTQLDQTSH
ncbi:MAG: hypothetical protein EPO21_05990 [Chloroflexota bacterium]|nr:MAG: hypothetical protein EPO21_05990 [Chloroflexota bacterium]